MLDFSSSTLSLISFPTELLAATSLGDSLSNYANYFWWGLQVAIGLGFVIFVHELGHFLAAKFFGVKCEKFYVGFDVPIRLGPIRLPAKLFHFQWGETEYGIGSIPLGGYVKMLGQDDDPRNAEKESERIRLANADPVEAVGRAQYDPRSFPAKSVFARMVIISAGVIMNILFGILFAAVAFNMGVPYEPAIVGEVIPGDPAWASGLQSGDQIVQLAEMTEPSSRLKYEDILEKITLAGFEDPSKPIPVLVNRDSKSVQLSIQGTTRHDPNGQLLRLGIGMQLTTKVHETTPFDPMLKAESAGNAVVLPDLKPGDLIVGVNGTELPRNAESEGVKVPLERDLNLLVHPLFDQVITLQVEREGKEKNAKPERLEVSWNPLPIRTLGIGFQAGPVTAVQAGSAADKAGVKIGDELVAFDGQPIDDAFSLPLIAAKKRGETVKLTLKKGAAPQENSAPSSEDSSPPSETNSTEQPKSAAGETFVLEWKVPDQFLLRDVASQYDPVGIEIPGSGLVYRPLNIVSRFSQAGAEDANLTLQPGDEIQQIRLDLDGGESQIGLAGWLAGWKSWFTGGNQLRKTLGEAMWSELERGKKLEKGYSSHFVHSLIQRLPVGTKFRVYFLRDNKVENVGVQVANDTKWMRSDRGLITQPTRRIYQTATVGEAMSLGVQEVINKAAGVLRFLRMVFTWKVPRKAASGPAGIIFAATSAASEGIPTLLLFLTLLSANLAVLNFLPIPALDGGHMVFLIAEALRGKPVNEALQVRLTVAGVLALLALMLFVTLNDADLLTRYFNLR